MTMDAYILDAVRTPRGKGKASGSLHEVTPMWLATRPLVALRERNHLDAALVDDVVMGCVVPVGEQGGNIGRIAALEAGYPASVPGVQINRYCGSGLEAVGFAAARILAGMADLAIGGGVEMMSRVPMGSDGGAWAQDPQVAFDTYFIMQGVSADLLASLRGYNREQCDAFAAESHRRAHCAWERGYFGKSVIPVKDFLGLTLLERDETIRPETTVETLAALKPAFKEMGERYGYDGVALQRYPQIERIRHIHHAGNSSGVVDGAAAVLVGNQEAVERTGLAPRARIRAFATVGADPTLMLAAPAASARKALARAGMSASDIDIWEINEAFSAVVLNFMGEMQVADDIVNVNGGAIAMGHPLGATGAMLVGTVLDELERRGLSTALITLCVAAGMGSAMIIERI
ncbi:MAG TPA: acetyl-CoA C-acetyltransferase [Nevskiaceae bacterium]|nr:acetyl-CoA C-acetyltransferase [Nevskiaceae bacterium]